MILLLDGNAVFWALNDERRIAASARSALVEPANDLLVSAATVWELEIKLASGKLRAPGDILEGLRGLDAEIVPVIGLDGRSAARLPGHHRDPFDRMLVAQASRLGAVIVSSDAIFDRYGIERLAI